MAREFLTIRQMCDTFKVSARTLRFYEAKELLFPCRLGQKRMFTPKDRARMTLILKGKRFGFSLEEIRQLLNLYSIGDRQRTQITTALKLAGERMDALLERRNELNRAIKDLKVEIDAGAVYLAEIENTSDAAQ